MDNQLQTSSTLQGVTSPQNVRQNSSIQSGSLNNDQLNTFYYNTPSNAIIVVPGVSTIGPSGSSSISVSSPTTTKNKTSNLVIGGIVLSVGIVICLIALNIKKFKP